MHWGGIITEEKLPLRTNAIDIDETVERRPIFCKDFCCFTEIARLTVDAGCLPAVIRN